MQNMDYVAISHYLLGIRIWCIRMLEDTPKEDFKHFPLQAAVEGMIDWGKIFSQRYNCKMTQKFMIFVFISAIRHIPGSLVMFHDMVDRNQRLVPRHTPPGGFPANLSIRYRVMASYTKVAGTAENPIIIK